MKWSLILFVVAFAYSCLAQNERSGPVQTPVLSADSEIVLSDMAPSAFRTIIDTALDNAIPIGITLDPKHRLCDAVMNVGRKREKLSSFISEVNSAVPGYRSEFRNGVLRVHPIDPSTPTQSFLDLRIPEFHSGSDTHRGLGVNLWMFIRAEIAPGQGTGFVGGSAPVREIVPGIDTKGETVQTILDRIVRKGRGAAWILDASKLRDLSKNTPRPYEIFAYSENAQALRHLECSTGSAHIENTSPE